MQVLTVNVGGSAVRLGAHSTLAQGATHQEKFNSTDKEASIQAQLKSFIEKYQLQNVSAVSHRIVHAGAIQSQRNFIDERLEQMIHDHTHLAPNHNPQTLKWIRESREILGDTVPQIAVFDSGFYVDLPEIAASYAIPQDLGFRRLGFHGLAHQSMLLNAQALAGSAFAGMRIISLQLGSGCSITASIGGTPVDTSMGFTPLEGLMMNTRSGDIDPGIILHLLGENEMTAGQTDDLLNRQSGLLGVSERSGNIDELLSNEDDKSSLAVEMFCYRVKKYIGAYVAALGGLDLLLLGGGIGENLPQVRAKCLSGLETLGVQVDPNRNPMLIGQSGLISSDKSKVRVEVSKVDENSLLAEEAIAHLFQEESAVQQPDKMEHGHA